MTERILVLGDSESEMKKAIEQIHDLFKNGITKEVLVVQDDIAEKLKNELKTYGIVQFKTKRPTQKEHFIDTVTEERYALRTNNPREDRNYYKHSCEIKRTFGDGTNRYSSSGADREYNKDCEKYLQLLDFVLYRRNILVTNTTIRDIKKKFKI